jgi:Spy/CpxP family protein refolding chaperone
MTTARIRAGKMSASRTRLWFALFVVAVFGAGMASGVILGRRLWVPVGADADGFGPPPPGPGFGRRGGPPPPRLMERLTARLELTDEQRTKVDAVLRSRRERLDQLQREVGDRFEREQHELRTEIRALLTPDQQEKFDRWVEETSRRGQGRRNRPPRPPDVK